MATGIKVLERNPFKLLTYPDSGNQVTNSSPHPVSVSSEITTANKETITENAESTTENELLNPQPSPIGTTMNPGNDVVFEEKVLTREAIYEAKETIFPDMARYCKTANQLNYWLGKEGVWGQSKKYPVNGKQVVPERFGLLDPDFAAATEDTLPAYWKYCKVQAADYEVIGCTRKSTTSDTEKTRASLLQLMINKLIYRGLAEKVFVSPYADATSEIQTRDHQKCAILKKLKYCDGNVNDLIRLLHCQQKKI
ncbi:hypothetical protein BJV82DRAFT_672421 [Fennellomyces sp. T-0311]|nr:hypothetical protein BJV82DRAFT_672421 [Fennellomyces sp. T-0311]